MQVLKIDNYQSWSALDIQSRQAVLDTPVNDGFAIPYRKALHLLETITDDHDDVYANICTLLETISLTPSKGLKLWAWVQTFQGDVGEPYDIFGPSPKTTLEKEDHLYGLLAHADYCAVTNNDNEALIVLSQATLIAHEIGHDMALEDIKAYVWRYLRGDDIELKHNWYLDVNLAPLVDGRYQVQEYLHPQAFDQIRGDAKRFTEMGELAHTIASLPHAHHLLCARVGASLTSREPQTPEDVKLCL